ncbi:MAG: metallophosphoesterase [Nitrospirota bacterium]
MFILFISVALAVLLGITYFCYYSFAEFFGITAPAARHAALAIFIFFSLSFVFATLLAHREENLFTRAYYAASGFWLGLLVNLLMASIAAWIIIWVFAITSHKASPAIIGGVFLSIALIYSVYGVWNAFHPRVKEITVRIKNLPEAWKGKTIVQLSDVHLGLIYKRNFLEKIVKMTNGLRPDMVVITGDLFDGMDGASPSLVAPLNDLAAPDGVYFVTGNHETYLGVKKAFSILETTKVIILNDSLRDIHGLQLIGVSYPKRGQTKSIIKTIKAMPGFVAGKPTILLYHSPVMIDQAREAGVNLELCGHTHKGQIFPANFITHAIYDGHDYGLFTMGDYSLYVTNGVGGWGPPMRTGNTPEIVDIKLY